MVGLHEKGQIGKQIGKWCGDNTDHRLNSGVAYHPSNKGMRLISDEIWKRVSVLSKTSK